jgi:hypothetical protein
MNIEPILKLIENYGLSLVLLLIVLFWLRPKIDDLWKMFVKSSRDNKNKDPDDSQEIRKLLTSEVEINALLSELLINFNCVRTGIWQFHNGVRSLGGIPFLKVSLTHERTKIESIIGLYQNIPVSLISKLTEHLLDEEFIRIDFDSDDYEGITKEMRNSNTKTNHFFPVKDHNDHLIGIIFLAHKEEVEMTQDQIIKIKNFSQKIATILEKMADAIKKHDKKHFVSFWWEYLDY